MGYNELVDKTEVTIADGASVSGAVNMNGGKLIGIEFPASMTNSSFNVQVSDTGADGTWKDVYDNSGIRLSVVVRTNSIVYFFPFDVASFRKFVRLSGGAETGAKTLNFLVRPL